MFALSAVVFFINDTADAFVGHIPTNAVFVVGAEDKTMGAALVLGVVFEDGIACSSTSCKEVKNQAIIV